MPLLAGDSKELTEILGQKDVVNIKQRLLARCEPRALRFTQRTVKQPCVGKGSGSLSGVRGQTTHR
ncbi:MAG: hypothetical protein ATN32_10060 [Candidatus Epulonipiscium fishelsonii]|nr:MAG: hypothetical protein ATN32_10060 [Epulopiscium sp. AS2M-Bin002]